MKVVAGGVEVAEHAGTAAAVALEPAAKRRRVAEPAPAGPGSGGPEEEEG
jgi:hypothetical protein